MKKSIKTRSKALAGLVARKNPTVDQAALAADLQRVIEAHKSGNQETEVASSEAPEFSVAGELLVQAHRAFLTGRSRDAMVLATQAFRDESMDDLCRDIDAFNELADQTVLAQAELESEDSEEDNADAEITVASDDDDDTEDKPATTSEDDDDKVVASDDDDDDDDTQLSSEDEIAAVQKARNRSSGKVFGGRGRVQASIIENKRLIAQQA